MIKNIVKYKNIYIFIITLAIIGFISGISYYQIQTSETKQDIKEKINIKEELSNRINNIPISLKTNSLKLIFSISIFLIIINILNLFLKPFQIGFLFSFLTTYKLKFSIIYISIYYLIPLLVSLILTRVSITITYNLIKYLIAKDKKTKQDFLNSIKKYLLIFTIELIYQVIIFLISPNVNAYLMTII